MSGNMDWESQLEAQLFALQDPAYRDFNRSLLPGLRAELIGVRIPQLRALAKTFAKSPDCEVFLHSLPHRYHEENHLHSFLIAGIKDPERLLEELERFLPYVENWSVCDSLTPRLFKTRPSFLLPKIREWLSSERIYTVRFGIKMLMDHYLDEFFSPEHLIWISEIGGAVAEEYYVRMMQAWYFATALAKQYDAALLILTENRLPVWTHNKTIQKAVESYRITDQQKTFLKTLRRKEK